METSKTCSKCGVRRPLDDFFADRAKSDGYRTTCKPCDALLDKQQRDANIDAAREQSRHQYRANRDPRVAYMRRYSQELRDGTRTRTPRDEIVTHAMRATDPTLAAPPARRYNRQPSTAEGRRKFREMIARRRAEKCASAEVATEQPIN